MNKIIPFDYHGNEVRSLMINNEPWFVAKDVCDMFGETNRNRAMQSLDDDEKGYTQMTTPGGMQQMSIVNESGLYALLFAMQPEKARGVSDEYIAARQQQLKDFKRWITHDVLPALRKTGAYSISGYAPKATSLGEVASFLKVMRSIMKENRQPSEKIAEMAETVCKQFNVKIPKDFVRHNPFEQTSLFNITANIILPPHAENKQAKSR